MARISELHYSNAYAAKSGVKEFIEIALETDEDAGDYSVAFYQSNGSPGEVVTLDDPKVQVTFDADANEWVYVISAEDFPILLTDPNGGGANNYEAYALVDTDTDTVVNFLDIGGGTQNIVASGGLADGAVSTNIPVPTGPNAATYSIQFNAQDPETAVFEPLSVGDSGLVCFAAGTLIRTPQGEVAIENLAVGDLVETLDAGAQEIAWIGRKTVQARGKFSPIEFASGTIGNARKLRVSPQHRVLLNGAKCEILFGQPEVLVPAHFLINDKSIRRKNELCPKVGDGLKRAAYHGGVHTPSFSKRKDMPPWPNLQLPRSKFHRSFRGIR